MIGGNVRDRVFLFYARCRERELGHLSWGGTTTLHHRRLRTRRASEEYGEILKGGLRMDGPVESYAGRWATRIRKRVYYIGGNALKRMTRMRFYADKELNVTGRVQGVSQHLETKRSFTFLVFQLDQQSRRYSSCSLMQ